MDIAECLNQSNIRTSVCCERRIKEKREFDKPHGVSSSAYCQNLRHERTSSAQPLWQCRHYFTEIFGCRDLAYAKSLEPWKQKTRCNHEWPLVITWCRILLNAQRELGNKNRNVSITPRVIIKCVLPCCSIHKVKRTTANVQRLCLSMLEEH